MPVAAAESGGSWFEAINGMTGYGTSFGHDPDAGNNGEVSVREAVDYSGADDPARIDDPHYVGSPAGCVT